MNYMEKVLELDNAIKNENLVFIDKINNIVIINF
jgi:hypothetical protein